MEIAVVGRLLFLFIHLLAFAVAAGYILREDLRFLRGGGIDRQQLAETATVVAGALAILWVTGLLMILIDTGGNLAQLASMPKLLAKLTVVIALTVNGVLLHKVAFPALMGERGKSNVSPSLLATVGAISGVSWSYAAFVGISKPVAGMLGYSGYMALYALVLLGGIGIALNVVRPKIAQVINLGPAH